jgi:anti-anti-sigma factor
MTFTDLAVPGLVVSVSVEGTASVVTLRGQGDLATLPVLVKVLARVIAEDDGAVIVDLAEADFFDTASARVVGRAAQYLDTRGRPLTIRAASRQAAMVLAAFRLSHLLESAATRLSELAPRV